jgi:hypothetical protein
MNICTQKTDRNMEERAAQYRCQGPPDAIHVRHFASTELGALNVDIEKLLPIQHRKRRVACECRYRK